MLIAISSEGPDLRDKFSYRFGRSPWFLIMNTETNSVSALANDYAKEASGAGVGAAALVIKGGAQTIISGAVGPQAFKVLSEAEIPIYLAPEGISIEGAVKKFKDGQLKKMTIKVF